MACVRKRDNRWVVDYRDHTGRRHIEKRFKTRKEAEHRLRTIQQDIDQGSYEAPTGARRFDELADAFEIGHIAVQLRATTARDYRTNLRLHVLPYFTCRKLRGITRDTVDQFRRHLLEKGTGRRTVNKCITLLAGMFVFAVERDWMVRNPAARFKKLPAESDPRDDVDESILSPAEIRLLVNAAEGRWRLIILTAVTTGLREGELLGLRWQDVSLSRRRIHVRQQYTDGRFSKPKTKASRRAVDMPTVLAHELTAWKLACPKGPEDLVFPNGAGNPESHGNLLSRGYYPALRRAGVRRINFHALRHCYASLLIANGEHPKRIQALMGHSTIRITFDTYGHLIEDPEDDVADALANRVFGNKTVTWGSESEEGEPQAIDYLVARGGIEPPTRGFSVHCSTD